MLTGGCACGAVRFVARGRPRRVGLCHCTACRKAHAAAFNAFVVFPRDAVEVTGTLTRWRSSPGYERAFCPACGSRVTGGEVDTDEIELSLGSLDEPGRVAPEYENWTEKREPWLPALDLPQNPRDPDFGSAAA